MSKAATRGTGSGEMRRKSYKFLQQVLVLTTNTSFLQGNADNEAMGPVIAADTAPATNSR
jgi:hypothetical protein